ncbi:MAG: glycosyltransferase [Desulfobacteraceae bacterium]|nr:glycosyltransferase [Desulfobacteraceae bacterium]MBC2748983.1 TIGR04283 family arsenosugar biosynthesis glycosyltransferase [Desulfobacteraceae bacterium]
MNAFVGFSAGWLLDMLVLSQSGPAGRSPVVFAVCYILGFGFMALMVRTCPRDWSLRRVAFVVISIGVAGRIGFFWFPVSNDVYRYVWEGFIQNQGFNPYQIAPNDPLLAGLIQGDMATIWQQINHKDFSAAYPPLIMHLFRALSAISSSPILFKITMIGFDLVTIGALVLIVQRRKIPPAHLFWYVANPLVLVYVAGEAHLDIVQAAFLMWALYFIGCRKPVMGFLAMGMAAVSKYFAIVALPFVIKRSNRHAWPAIFLAGIAFIPFMHDPEAVFRTLFLFGSRMHYNDGLAEILRFLFGTRALPVLCLILLSLLAGVYLFVHDTLRSVYLALGALLLCLPTLHSWYLLLMAPLMVIYPSRAWLYLMLATIATLPVLVTEYHTGVFQENKWLKLIEYIPFYGLLIYDTLKRRLVLPSHVFPLAGNVSVIMPVLNEAERVEAAIQSVHSEPEVAEIIVVDGGSRDATCERARQADAIVISGPRGRGPQVRAGLDLATGDVLLVLHADTALAAGGIKRMLQALADYPRIAGGAFEMRFTGDSLGLRAVACLNNWRARWCGISFGDQGQFFRRDALNMMGGFPDMMLMEDVELSLRLKQFERPLFIRRGVCVSQRRWVRRGFVKNIWKVLTLFTRYLFERRMHGAAGIRTDYYRKYYGCVEPVDQ